MTEKIGKCHDCTAPQTEVNMLSRHILELQADKGRLTDRVQELEAEVKEWKDKADLWCKTANLKDHNIMINKELEKENAELKCECRRCVYSDSPCILSDYGKDRNGICDHFKDVFDEIVELRDEQKELLKDTAIYDSMLTKAKNLLQKVADVCGYPNYDIPVELYSDIADFLKDSEVKK